MFATERFYWLAQVLGWGGLSTLILLAGLNGPKQPGIMDKHIYQNAVMLFVVGICLTHIMRSVIIKLNWLNLQAGKLILRLLLLCAGTAIVFASIDMIITVNTIPSAKIAFGNKFFVESFLYFLFLLLWIGIYTGVYYAQKSRIQELNNLQLTASRNEIELKNLRSQLNPHFLFNSLNSIRALVDIDPSQAKENITTLSNLLRKSLILGKEKLISLKEELDLVNDYLELEKVRFEERLEIELIHDNRLNDLQVPPFILQTLVENAFKHGISRLIEGGKIRILTEFSGNKILISVENDGELREKMGTGIGLANTLRRLELLYGPLAVFTLRSENKKVIASIELTQ